MKAYAGVLRTKGMTAWLVVVLAQRLPVAMSPLALLLLGREVTGSYAIGAVLAGLFAMAEAVLAGWLGRRFDRRSPRAEMRLVLQVQAAAFVGLAVAAWTLTGTTLIVTLIVFTAVAGGAAAGAHGGLRALLVKIVPERDQQAALSLESSLTTLLWAVSPAAVGALAVTTGSLMSALVMAALAAIGAMSAGALPEPAVAASHGSADRGIWRRGWPAMAQEGAVMMVVGAAYTTLPALLGDATVAGLVLAGFAAAGIVGGLVYGGRRWPGRYRSQSVALIVVLSLAAVTASWTLTSPLLLVIGFLATPALAARASGLQVLLPEREWAAGFSGLYAAGGLGFAAAGFLAAPLLDGSTPWIGLAGPAALAAIVTLVSGRAEAKAPLPGLVAPALR
ncbi:hypothetical protein DP939_27980 [Spongiactinospora rosea]|uniref:MFS transporter n=1 Tax=Spongiactinospora rosea TaxID=2248750 RepID=A0A366LSJ1_9ACTN|nr:hypothetical protein [Spongiactinospora rosea]RBQ16906.1 hypothetical protein DP939_27980 [Spongiactinospora rosea]